MANLLTYGERILYHISYHPTLKLWYDALSIKPSENLMNNLDILIRGLESDNILNELDLFHVLGGLETDEQRLRPIKTTSSTQTFTNVNGVTLNYSGATGNGVNGYINLNWDATLNANKYTQDACSFGFYSRTDSIELNGIDIHGNLGSGRTYVYLKRTSGGNLIARINTNADFNPTNVNPDSRGFYSFIRDSSTTVTVKRNSNTITSGTSISGLQTTNSWNLCGFLGSNATTRNYSEIHIGSSNINQLNFYNRIQTYMTSVGLNV